MLSALAYSVVLFLMGRSLLYREPQYSVPSWLLLLGVISNAVGLGSILITT